MKYKRWEKAVTYSWLTHLWKFISDNEIILEGNYTRLEKMREDDINIMDRIYESHISDADLAAANRCRCYLGVVWASEITTGDGKRLKETVRECIKDNTFESPYKWQQQGKPSHYDIRKWKECLAVVFGIAENGLGWNHNLGSWKGWTKELNWKYYYHERRLNTVMCTNMH